MSPIINIAAVAETLAAKNDLNVPEVPVVNTAKLTLRDLRMQQRDLVSTSAANLANLAKVVVGSVSLRN